MLREGEVFAGRRSRARAKGTTGVRSGGKDLGEERVQAAPTDAFGARAPREAAARGAASAESSGGADGRR